MTSPFIYVNAELPKAYSPPDIGREATLTEATIRELVALNDVSIETTQAGPVAERLLGIFSHPEVIFGDKTFIESNRAHWLDRLQYFIADDRPIEFVAMALPYKVPNPLKTNRSAPDLGEALMLRRFDAVLKAVEAVYPPGARLTILEEGILGRCQGVDPRRIAAYRAGIDRIVEISGVNRQRLVIHSLDEMVTAIPNFEARWIQEQERMRILWQQGDPDTISAYATTVPASRTSVPTLDYDPAVLAKAYDASETDSALRYVRDYIDKVAHRHFFAYRSLIALRDATGYLQNLRPYALKLTVSPKPENLAVIPVNRWSRILPYHGVPVLDANGMWRIEYLAAMGSDNDSVEAIRVADDGDANPIGYRTA